MESAAQIKPGIRVVRGPNWIWQNQDSGEGNCGTVCEIGKAGSTHSPERTVVVNWDSGHRTNYRVGYQGQYDLIVVDNAQIGVKHQNICDGACNKAGISGILFRCEVCNNFDLCSTCYGNDIHNLDHSFIRYQSANSVGVRVPPREGATKIQLKGIFVGAKVIRGPDWEWGTQDGGEGKTGRVMEIRGWDNESCRSVANVSWVSGSTNVYRLGHKGNVDLKFVQPAVGGYYYKEHMPVLGQRDEQQPVVPATRPTFFVGDRVRVCLDKESLMRLQQGHGGWNPRMLEYLSKIGTVHRITDKGDIRVQYENCANRWTFHPNALQKIFTYHVGDLVTILNDACKVQQFQKNHGEWVDTMRNALGKTCKIIKIYADGDLRVTQLEDGFAWTLNPKCVKLERSPLATAAERSNSMMDLSNQRTDHVLMPLPNLSSSSAASEDKLVREAAQGKLEYVQHYLSLHPDQVDVMSGGKNCLQVAAHQGHIAIVNYLLSIGANVNAVDKEGDSTLHYAAFGNQPEIMAILLQNGANINVLNASHCTALHISAHKKPPNCVKVLLDYKADVNIQDSYGDTALHDAIGKENNEVIEMLSKVNTLDLTIRNKRGFNSLHHASLKGNVMAARRILQLARQIVDVRKEDGFAALHLAALNGHANVVEVLVREGHADIDIKNDRRQTPFLLAVSQGHAAALEKLIDLGCDILAKDEDGDNAMHLCIIKKANLVQEVSQIEAPKIFEIYENLSFLTRHRLMYTLLCFLAQSGCKMEPNHKGAQVFDWIPEKDIRDLILSYEAKALQAKPTDRSTAGTSNDSSAAEIGELYNNIESLNLTVNDTTATTNPIDLENSSNIKNAGNIDNSNPPTPARRNRMHSNVNNNNNNRDTTPSPSLNFLIPSSGGSGTVVPATEEETKKLNVDQILSNRSLAISPPPTTSSSSTSSAATPAINITGFSSNSSASEHPTTSNANAIEAIAPAARVQNVEVTQPVPRHSRKQIPPKSQLASNTTNVPIPVSAEPSECVVCNEMTNLISFEPCLCRIACEDCCIRMKKCLACGSFIEKRISSHGKILHSKENNRQPSADRLRYLESKILEIEETHCCSICMERRRNVAFLCGHSACLTCSATLKICHMCRKTITKKINLY